MTFKLVLSLKIKLTTAVFVVVFNHFIVHWNSYVIRHASILQTKFCNQLYSESFGMHIHPQNL